MENILIVIGFIFFVVLRNLVDKKKEKKPIEKQPRGSEGLPPPIFIPFPQTEEKKPLDFEIPKIKGAPQEAGVYREEKVLAKVLKAEERSKKSDYHEMKEALIEEQKILKSKQRKEVVEKIKNPYPQLTANTMFEAVLFAEILAKPKAQARRNPYWRR